MPKPKLIAELEQELEVQETPDKRASQDTRKMGQPKQLPRYTQD
jgi:hypothetical protein